MPRIFIDTHELDSMAAELAGESAGFADSRQALLAATAATPVLMAPALVGRALELSARTGKLGDRLHQASTTLHQEAARVEVAQAAATLLALLVVAPSQLARFAWPGSGNTAGSINPSLFPGLITATPVAAPSLWAIGGGPSPNGQFVGGNGIMTNDTARVLNSVNSAMAGPLSPVRGNDSWVNDLLKRYDDRRAAGQLPSQIRAQGGTVTTGSGTALGQANAANAIFTKIGAGTSIVGRIPSLGL